VKPSVRDYRTPLELTAVGLGIAAVVFLLALVGLYLTDVGIANW
jgi:hypothetical protein